MFIVSLIEMSALWCVRQRFHCTSKKIFKLLDTGGLDILKQIHLLFEMVNSEQIHSILSDVYSGIVLQIKPFFTNSMRPPPYLSLSSLQWNLSKADTYGTEVSVRFKEVSALERFELKSSQI